MKKNTPESLLPDWAGKLKLFFQLGAKHGCPPDQLMNFSNAGIILQERQLAASAAARLCDQPNGPNAVGYGGARGGGKSHWLLAQLGADDCQRMPGLKCLLLRKVGKSNLENFESLRQRLFKRLPHEFNVSRGQLLFPNGSQIILGHYRSNTTLIALATFSNPTSPRIAKAAMTLRMRGAICSPINPSALLSGG